MKTLQKDTRKRDRDKSKLNNTQGKTKSKGLDTNNYDFKNPGDIWDINTQPSPFSHYAMWPEKLVERMIKCSTRPGDIILDPFAGSGTTLAVAEKQGRQSIGFDLGYQDIQEKRLFGLQKELL